MFNLPANPLPLLKDLWARLPRKLLTLIAVGIFILGAMLLLTAVRGVLSIQAASSLTPSFLTATDATLTVLLALLVIVIISAVAYAVFYRES